MRNHRLRFGCIADDFTGATDIAAMLHRIGMRVVLTNGIPAQPAVAETDEADAWVIALKSRTIDPAEAVALSLAACRFLTGTADAQAIYFKYCSTFDSTDRGNIGPVLDALMRELGVDKTLASPSFPENGRRVFFGHLFVGGRLLSESSLANHPLTPMRDPDIVRVLSRQRQGPVGPLDHQVIAAGPAAIRGAFDAAASGTVLICDAIDDQDLVRVAAALPDLKLYSGGSAAGAAFAAAANPVTARHRGAAEPFTEATLVPLCISGSASEMTRRQVDFALMHGHSGFKVDPAHLDDPESAARQTVEQLIGARPQRPLVYATDTGTKVDPQNGPRLETFFGALARLARTAGFNTFVVAGGETSGAVVQALSVGAMRIGPEIAPGVPWMKAGDIHLALKSGNFGAEAFFDDAIATLRRMEAS